MNKRASTKRHIARRHVDKRLLFRLNIFSAISFIMLLVIIYDVFQNTIGLQLAIAGILIGAVLGLLAGRMFNILWHEEKRQVISQLDTLGAIILVLYIIFDLLRGWILAQWIPDKSLTAFTFAMIAGLMFGRFMSMGFRIRRILFDRGIFESEE